MGCLENWPQDILRTKKKVSECWLKKSGGATPWNFDAEKAVILMWGPAVPVLALEGETLFSFHAGPWIWTVKIFAVLKKLFTVYKTMTEVHVPPPPPPPLECKGGRMRVSIFSGKRGYQKISLPWEGDKKNLPLLRRFAPLLWPPLTDPSWNHCYWHSCCCWGHKGTMPRPLDWSKRIFFFFFF